MGTSSPPWIEVIPTRNSGGVASREAVSTRLCLNQTVWGQLWDAVDRVQDSSIVRLFPSRVPRPRRLTAASCVSNSYAGLAFGNPLYDNSRRRFPALGFSEPAGRGATLIGGMSCITCSFTMWLKAMSNAGNHIDPHILLTLFKQSPGANSSWEAPWRTL